ncbi:hypothetical protein ACVBEF_08165 [Glaciimonas sp. GG7]
MKKFEPPALHAAIIMGEDPFLIARLSALIAQKGKYLSIIDGPRVTRPDAEAEVIRRKNAVARTRAKKIIIAGIPGEIAGRFAPHFPSHMTINVDHVGQATNTVLGIRVRSGTPIQWGNTNIGVGLLRALQTKVPIEFTDIPSEARYAAPQGDHLVVCEDDNELSQVIAANYAYSIGAGLCLIKTVDKDEAETLCEEFYGAYDNRHESMSSILGRLSERLKVLSGDIPMSGVRGITFISKAIPWGFAFREVPTTHLFSYPDLGISIINGVAAEQQNSPRMRVAAVIDPATIPSTEVEKMAVALAKKGVLVRGFRGPSATVNGVVSPNRRNLSSLPKSVATPNQSQPQ